MRRSLLAAAATLATMGAAPKRGGLGASNVGLSGPLRDAEDPDFLAAPATDQGTMPNLDHVPPSVLAKNFGVPESAFADIPKKELYIFQAAVPGPPEEDRVASPNGSVPQSFKHRMTAEAPQQNQWARCVSLTAPTSRFRTRSPPRWWRLSPRNAGVALAPVR